MKGSENGKLPRANASIFSWLWESVELTSLFAASSEVKDPARFSPALTMKGISRRLARILALRYSSGL
jgi:hypothetical protein